MAYQPKLMVKLAVVRELIQGLLSFIGRVNDFSTLQMLLKTLFKFKETVQFQLS